MRFVASDLEGTLTAGETWRGVGRYPKRNGRATGYRAFLLTRPPGVLLAKAGLADGQAVKDGFIEGMARLFRGMTGAELDRMAEWVAGEELWPRRRREVLAELGAHAEAGRRVVLAAGGYGPVVEAFARRIGAEAVGTPLEFSGGRATGRLVGGVSTGRAKAQRLRELVGTGGLRAAYGDTSADLFMLEMSEDPVAVRPDPRLREEASRRARTMTRAALMAAVAAAVAAQLAVPLPFTPVPFTLQVLAVVLSGLLLGPRRAALAMAVYVLVGAVGAPVFSQFGGGLGVVLGPRGGTSSLILRPPRWPGSPHARP